MSLETPYVSIDDDNIVDGAPIIRARAVARLELLWQVCLPHLNPQLDPDSDEYSRPDPRWAEIGLRVIDRIARIYRLDKPVAAPEAEDTTSDPERTRALITAGLDQLEAAVAAAQEAGTEPAP